MAIIFGTEVHISGDKILSTENSIILLNHRTRVDWNFFWAVMYFGSKPRSHRAKMVLKDPLRHVPSLGTANFIFDIYLSNLIIFFYFII